uniref:Reverse transcriptase/retrotransposon-derived protein RNase H-like domain-containing protein n=1 Tax=Lactuca sativa TaxID=4236 RepID=A0A9R1UR27_LACSA|nr:hypothetical protein LSAT_V11C800451480 [Lactuca sativa]
MTECMNDGKSSWTKEAGYAFEELKQKVTQAPVLGFPNFNKVFQVECDASGLGIGRVLSQNQKPMIRNFMPLFVVWNIGEITYSLTNLFSDHEAIKYVQGQQKLNPRHAKWVEFLQDYSFVIRHRAGSSNTVVDALSRRYILLSEMKFQVCGFDSFRDLYQDDPYFRTIWNSCKDKPLRDFSRHDGYLFKGARLCIPVSSLRDSVINESHVGGLVGHFGRDRTLDLIHGRFFGPRWSVMLPVYYSMTIFGKVWVLSCNLVALTIRKWMVKPEFGESFTESYW